MRLVKENCARKIDSFGRVSIPKALRDRLELAVGEKMEIYTIDEGDKVYICLEKVRDPEENNEVEDKCAKVATLLGELGIDVPAEVAKNL